MKRIAFILLGVASLPLSAPAQTYYHMWRGSGQAGKPEWIANSALAYPFTGIQFTTADKFRGVVNSEGRWLLWKPTDPVTAPQNVGFVNGNLNAIADAAAGTHGSLVAYRYVMTDLSASGNIDSYYGYGRQGDVILSCQMQKWLRLNSYGGVALWGNGGGGTDDNPSFLVAGSYIESRLPFVQRGGALTVTESNITTSVGTNEGRTAVWLGTITNNGLEFGANSGTALYIGNGQNIFLGFDRDGAAAISDPLKLKYNVFCRKGVLSADYAIAPVNSWSDFVFDDGYELMPLDEVERFVGENGHLPDVPSEAEVRSDGYSQHEMNKALLQKIEELTLHVIRQQKEIEALRLELDRHGSAGPNVATQGSLGREP